MFVFRITIIACFFLDHIYAEEATKFPCVPCSVCNEEVTACDGSQNCVYNLTTGECQPKIIKPQDACCLKKDVGGKSYTFLMDEDTSPYNCMNSCVYTEDGNPGSKVCFKEGGLVTKCASDSETYPPPCWPCSECNGLPEECRLSGPFCRYNQSSELCIGYYPKTELYPPVCDPCSNCDDMPQLCWRSFPHCLYDTENKTCDARFTDTATYQTSCDPCSQCDNEPNRCLRSFPVCDYDFEDNTCIKRYTETNSPPCDPCSECNGYPLNCFQSYPVCVYNRKEQVCYERFTETNPLPCTPCSQCDNDPKDCLQSFPDCFYDRKNETCQVNWCNTNQTIMNDCNIDCIGQWPTLGPEFELVYQNFTSVSNISGNGFVTNWIISSGPPGQAINLKCPKADPALDADVVCEKGRWVVPDRIKNVCGTQN